MNHLKSLLSGRAALSFHIMLLGLAALLAVAPVTGAAAHEYKLGSLEIQHPWSRATLPGAKVAGGYLLIRNTGSTPDRLVSAASEIAEKTEIHEMSVTDGVMTMRPLAEGIEIPAGGEVKLEPGAYHLMFMKLRTPAVEGVKFSGTLTFEKAGTIPVEFAVDKAGGDHSGHGG